MSTTQQQARRAGLLYVAIVLIAPIGLMYVPGELIVAGNATATADNIRAAEGLFRLGVASELVQQAIGIFLVLALYRLFKPVSEGLSRQLVVRSRFIPKVFGYLLMVAGTAYLAAAASAIALPQFSPIVSKIALAFEVAELPIVFWLVIWGAKPIPTNGLAASA